MQEKKHVTDTGCRGGHCLKGVVCDVEHCTFNDGANHCYASSISVGPHGADCSAETVCATFKPKTY